MKGFIWVATIVAVAAGLWHFSVSVGDYSKEFGGWPVYAAHAETCHESRIARGQS